MIERMSKTNNFYTRDNSFLLPTKANRFARPGRKVWVLYENGQAPKRSDTGYAVPGRLLSGGFSRCVQYHVSICRVLMFERCT
jgi:hypothetical protein